MVNPPSSTDGSPHGQSDIANLSCAASQRVVILGASNVIRNISTVLTTAERFRGKPLEILAAIGHGRSYGMNSRVLGRSLPPIRTCGLWKALSERPQVPTVSLLTDVGNDLLYGASVDAIASWVEDCLTRLSSISDRVIVTELPLDNIARLNFSTFFLFRSILFPRSRLTLSVACDMSVALNNRIAQLASRYGASLIKPQSDWYGLDPIHVLRRHRDVAWQTILEPWQVETRKSDEFPNGRLRVPLRKCRPLVRWLWGIEQRRGQPGLTLPSGSPVSFF